MRHTTHKPAAFAALRLCARNPTHRSFRHGAHGTARRQSGVSAFSLSAFGRSAWSAYSALELPPRAPIARSLYRGTHGLRGSFQPNWKLSPWLSAVWKLTASSAAFPSFPISRFQDFPPVFRVVRVFRGSSRSMLTTDYADNTDSEGSIRGHPILLLQELAE
jgi:hypothetical protein